MGPHDAQVSIQAALVETVPGILYCHQEQKTFLQSPDQCLEILALRAWVMENRSQVLGWDRKEFVEGKKALP